MLVGSTANTPKIATSADIPPTDHAHGRQTPDTLDGDPHRTSGQGVRTGAVGRTRLRYGTGALPRDVHNPLRYHLPIGEKLPLHLGAGKALAAWLPEDELRTLIDRSTPFTRISGQRVTADDLVADLRQVKDTGYALSVSERVLNVTAVSAPIRHDEHVLGALSLPAPSDEPTELDSPRLISEVRQAADAIAARCP
ncbi:IclR family transcriptional regulator domain-containing protein [Streptomyces sp. DSM 118148]|uniref:IclR family transcriptional regulator domain-containing protein n=1 Tax=Streptomyces sp. DSM 118148 TaxID=3448667 RepID=UPI004040075A